MRRRDTSEHGGPGRARACRAVVADWTRRVSQRLVTGPGRDGLGRCPRATIILPTHDRLRMLRECVDSLLADPGCEDYELIVWDNASTDGSAAYLDEVAAAHPQVRVVHHPENIGINALAAGVRLARGHYILGVDDDVVGFPRGWLDDMIRAFRTVPRAGYLAANVVQDADTHGAKPAPRFYHAVDYGRGVVIEHGPTGGWCTITSRDVVERIGNYKELPGRTFFLADGDFGGRCGEAGLRVGLVRDVRVYHAAGLVKAKEYGYLDESLRKYAEAPEFGVHLAAAFAAEGTAAPAGARVRSQVRRRRPRAGWPEFRRLHRRLVSLETRLALEAASPAPAVPARRLHDLAESYRTWASALLRRLPEPMKDSLRRLRTALRARGDEASGTPTPPPDSADAHRFLDGLAGIEIGGRENNAFHIPGCLNVDSIRGVAPLTEGRADPLPVDIVSPGDDLPFPDASLDYVLSAHVIEHFWDPVGALLEWARVVRPGGYLFMIVPHRDRTVDRDRPLTTTAELLRRHAAGPAEAPPTEPGPEVHHCVWTTQSFLELCATLGLQVVHAEDVDDKVGDGFTVVVRR